MYDSLEICRKSVSCDVQISRASEWSTWLKLAALNLLLHLIDQTLLSSNIRHFSLILKTPTSRLWSFFFFKPLMFFLVNIRITFTLLVIFSRWAFSWLNQLWFNWLSMHIFYFIFKSCSNVSNRGFWGALFVYLLIIIVLHCIQSYRALIIKLSI